MCAVAFVEVRTDSASSPRQYSRVLICFAGDSSPRPDATRNCSNRLRQRDHSSGVLKLKGSGGFSCILAISMISVISLLPPCNIISKVILNLN